MAKKAYKIPDGFEDEAAFMSWVREEFQADVDADRLNREAQLEDIKFFAGEQWEAADIKARKGRPCLTINGLPQFVAQVVGDIRINRPSIKIRPAEENDKEEADVREGLIRQIERESDAQGVYADAGQAQCVGGQGGFEITLGYASNEVFDRVIGIKAIPNPLSIVWDRMSVEKTGKDASRVWIVDQMARKEFEREYPDAKPTDLDATVVGSSWITNDMVRITRLALIKETQVEIALMPSGLVVDLADAEPGVQPVRTRKTVRRSVCIYLTNGHTLLAEPVEWPIDRVPVIKVTGWETWVGERRDRWGLVRFAKDPQKLKNFWRSVSAETLALAPKAQWLIRESEHTPEDAFRESAKNGETVLGFSGPNEPKRVDPPPMPAALLNEAALASQDMKDVTGLHDASLGARSNETSGKAIMARQREGDVATYVYQDNLRASIRAGGDVINQLIPKVYDTVRTVTIMGEDDVPKPVRVNDPEAESAILFGNTRYDVVVDTGPSYSTKRVEAAETLTQLAQSMPILGQIAPDLIVKSFDIPMADDIAERLRKSLPPNLTADPDAPPDENAQQDPAAQQAQAMQAQQQQAQQQAAQIQMAEGEAKVRKAQADAMTAEANTRKAQADAIKAEAEARMAQIQAMTPPMGMAEGFEQGPTNPEPLAPGQGFPAP